MNYPSEWVSTRQLVWDEDKQSSDTIGPKKANEKRKNPLGLDIVPVDWGQTSLKRMGRHLLRLLFTFLSKKKIITCPRRKEEVKKSAQMAHMAITELHVECGRSWYERSVHVTRDMSCLALPRLSKMLIGGDKLSIEQTSLYTLSWKTADKYKHQVSQNWSAE